MPPKCQEKLLSHQQWDFHQMQFVFHELLIILEQYMSLQEEILTEKVWKAYYLENS